MLLRRSAPPPPFRPIHARLGLSEERFEKLLTAKIDDVLLTAKANRRREREGDCDGPTTSVPVQELHVLSKDEAYRFVETRGFPKTGPMLGVYWWAADLGRARFNFDFDFDRDDINILNAYD